MNRIVPGIAALIAVTAGGLTAQPAEAQMRRSAPAPTAIMKAAPKPVSRPGDLRSGAGYFIAPRYLPSVGDTEIYVDPVVILGSSPVAPGTPVLAQLGIEHKLADGLEFHANLSPISLIGVRGPLASMGTTSLGYALYYRSDSYPLGSNPFPPGTGPSFFGLVPVPGVAEARGAELRLNAMQAFAPFNLFVSPVAAVMSNRTVAGADIGLDLDLDRLVIGYTASAKYAVANPFPNVSGFQPFELQHSVGGRLVLNDASYLQAHYMLFPSDTYGNTVQVLVGGIGFRLAGR